MSEVQIPESSQVSISLLSIDQQNPNRMTKAQMEALKRSIKKYGFIIPIITNKDLLIADGEQRWNAAKALGMTEVSVICLPVADVDRRLLRQVLNKLKGEHQKDLDREEFDRIIEAGGEDELKALLLMDDEKLNAFLKAQDEVPYHETFEVIISCISEEEQKQVFNKLTEEGLKCRVLTL